MEQEKNFRVVLDYKGQNGELFFKTKEEQQTFFDNFCSEIAKQGINVIHSEKRSHFYFNTFLLIKGTHKMGTLTAYRF